MKTLSNLTRLVEQAGGKLEEDEGYGDTRVFQAVAPEGKLWAGSDLQCLLIHWTKGVGKQALLDHEDTYKDVVERVSYGLRDMTKEELEEHAAD